VLPGCHPSPLIYNEIDDVNNQQTVPIYKSRSVLLEINIKEYKTAAINQIENCNNRTNKWFFFKKKNVNSDVNCIQEGNTEKGSDSNFFLPKCVMDPRYESQLEDVTDKISQKDRGMSRKWFKL
jgi:hypothetical protein